MVGYHHVQSSLSTEQPFYSQELTVNDGCEYLVVNQLFYSSVPAATKIDQGRLHRDHGLMLGQEFPRVVGWPLPRLLSPGGAWRLLCIWEATIQSASVCLFLPSYSILHIVHVPKYTVYCILHIIQSMYTCILHSTNPWCECLRTWKLFRWNCEGTSERPCENAKDCGPWGWWTAVCPLSMSRLGQICTASASLKISGGVWRQYACISCETVRSCIVRCAAASRRKGLRIIAEKCSVLLWGFGSHPATRKGLELLICWMMTHSCIHFYLHTHFTVCTWYTPNVCIDINAIRLMCI